MKAYTVKKERAAILKALLLQFYFFSSCFIIIERLRFTFTPNGKVEFVACDQVFPLFSVYSLLLLDRRLYLKLG